MAFNICHSLDCRKGGLVTGHHNKLRDRVANHASKVFTPTHVHGDPKIYTACAMRGGKEKIKGSPLKYEEELKGGLLIRYLWMQ